VHNLDSLSVVSTHHHIFLWQEPIILYKENVIQENSKDAAAGSYVVQEKCRDVGAGSYVVREKCIDVSAGSCGSGIVQRRWCWQLRRSGKVQRRFCRQLLWFRKSAETVPAVKSFRNSAKTLLLAVHEFQENF
jgi:hypothetical protein